MRENKFRSWNEKEQKFYYFSDGRYYSDILLKKCISERVCLEFSWINAEQFTGLKDKNGVDIYEGDICKVLYTDWISKDSDDPRTIDEYLYDIAKTYIVYYDFNGFYFTKNLQDPYPQDINVGKYGFIQVIGNIYENSEAKILNA